MSNKRNKTAGGVKPAPGTLAANKALEASQGALPKAAVGVDGGAMKPAVVQTAKEVEQASKLQELGKSIIMAMGEVSVKYHALILYVRREQVMPKLLTHEMSTLGFAKSRIAEVKRVAYASNDVFSQYESKLIGFGKALELARLEGESKTAQLTAGGKFLLEQGAITDEDAEDATDDAQATAASTRKPTKRKSVTATLKAALADVGFLAGTNMKDKVVAGEVGMWIPFPQMPGGWVHVTVKAGEKPAAVKDWVFKSEKA